MWISSLWCIAYEIHTFKASPLLIMIKPIFSVPGLRKLESCSHSRQRCETCLERSLSQLTVRRAQKTMTRSCSDNTNTHHHNRCLNIHSLHNAHHNLSARVHSLDTPKVTKHTSGCTDRGEKVTHGWGQNPYLFSLMCHNVDVWFSSVCPCSLILWGVVSHLLCSLWQRHGLTTDCQCLCIPMKTITSRTTLLLPACLVSRPWIWPWGAARYCLQHCLLPSFPSFPS